MIELLRSRQVMKGAQVWQQGFEDWRPVEETRLALHVATPIDVPSSKRKIPDDKIWAAAFAPLLCLPLGVCFDRSTTGNIDHFTPLFADATAYLITVWLLVRDEKQLGVNGFDTSSFRFWRYLPPIYLFKREKAAQLTDWPGYISLFSLLIWYGMQHSDLKWIIKSYLSN